MTSASTAGEASAPPTPCRARATSSTPADGARTPASEATGQRGDGEQGDAGQEHPAAAEDVAGPAAEQQQAAERERVPVQHPGQAGRGEVQPGLDMRKRDVYDGRVE